MKIYGDLKSGNCLKVKWVCDRIALPYTWIDIDIMKGESRTPAFIKLNPWGQVPTVAFDDGRTLAQSNSTGLACFRPHCPCTGVPWDISRKSPAFSLT